MRGVNVKLAHPIVGCLGCCRPKLSEAAAASAHDCRDRGFGMGVVAGRACRAWSLWWPAWLFASDYATQRCCFLLECALAAVPLLDSCLAAALTKRPRTADIVQIIIITTANYTPDENVRIHGLSLPIPEGVVEIAPGLELQIHVCGKVPIKHPFFCGPYTLGKFQLLGYLRSRFNMSITSSVGQCVPKKIYVWIFSILALLPLLYVAFHAINGSRNLPYWDEYDSALDFVLGLSKEDSISGKVSWFLALSNEHRMLTSRSLFALEYWLTGGLNFHFVGLVGNLFLLLTCGILVWSVQTLERRIRLCIALSFIVFQLENYENFLWSGSSIDHYQVVFLAVVAIALLLKQTPISFMGACVFGVLANYTLVHGTMVWPVGAVLLGLERRWRHLAFWSVFAALVVGCFFWGFHTNPGHHIVSLSLNSAGVVLGYWLKLLGGPIALGNVRLAPVIGVVLLCLVVWLVTETREPKMRLAIGLVLFAVGSLLLVSVGRAGLYNTTGHIPSRYLILGSVAWALVIYMMLERWSYVRPFALLTWSLPALICFNLAANAAYMDRACSFLEARDRAVLRYKHSGVDGAGVYRLHPVNGRADNVLKEAGDKGVYVLPVLCEQRRFDNLMPNRKIAFFLDKVEISPRAVFVRGWAGLPRFRTKRGAIQLVLKSKQDFLVFSTVPMFRPDVAKVCKQPKWRYSGFAFAAGRPRIPDGDYEIGILLSQHGRDEYVMTGRRVVLQEKNAEETPRLAQAGTPRPGQLTLGTGVSGVNAAPERSDKKTGQ